MILASLSSEVLKKFHDRSSDDFQESPISSCCTRVISSSFSVCVDEGMINGAGVGSRSLILYRGPEVTLKET